MKRFAGLMIAVTLSVLAVLATTAAGDAAQVLGPEGRVYAVETAEGRYTAQFQRSGRYEDSRPRRGAWSFDGRTLCVIVADAGRRAPEYEVCIPFRDLRPGESYLTRAWTPDGSLARVTRVE